MTGRPVVPEIARRAQELKIMHLALMLSLPSILDPGLPILRTELARAQVPPHDDIPVQLFDHDGGPGKESLTFSMREILTAATTLRGDILSRDLMSISMLLGAIRIGDLILTGGHHRIDVPLMQFARHFRNACAHGDRWSFAPGQPQHPAVCRWLTLNASLNGKRATWETVTPRLYVEYLDDVANYFVPGSVPAPARAP